MGYGMRPKFLTGYGISLNFLTGYGIRTHLSGPPLYRGMMFFRVFSIGLALLDVSYRIRMHVFGELLSVALCLLRFHVDKGEPRV